jgi:hypothetical protein
MIRLFVTLALVVHMLWPLYAMAQNTLKTPLSYSLREYGVVLATALVGGLASWWIKVRRGELQAWNIAALIGELSVSAFAGMLAFWLCEYLNFHPLLTASIVGMSGHAGAKGLSWLESIGKKSIEKRLGVDSADTMKGQP